MRINVFFIHSHITYLISQYYIATRDLKKDSVRFILSRSYSIDDQIEKLDLSWFYNFLEEKSRIQKVFLLKKKIKKVDKILENLVVHKKFRLFVPQYNHSLFQILSSHSLCMETILIEEGITSYKKDKALYELQKRKGADFLAKLFSDRFVFNNPHYTPYPKNKFKNSLCIDKNCFPYLEKKVVLELDEEIALNYQISIKDGGSVFLLDSFMERTGIKEEIYLYLVQKTISLIKNENKELYVKFHPEQKVEIRKKTISTIKQKFENINIIILEDSCILELEFCRLKNLSVYGMHTSLLFYAHTFGHKVFSSMVVTSQIPEVNEYINHIMDENQKKAFLNYG